MRAWLIGSLCLLAVACDYDYDALRGPRRDGGMAVGPSDAGVTGLDPNAACESAFYCRRLSNGVDQLDLLFVVDNSNSMGEEQAAFTRELPDLVRSLTRGDIDLDGDRDFLPTWASAR